MVDLAALNLHVPHRKAGERSRVRALAALLREKCSLIEDDIKKGRPAILGSFLHLQLRGHDMPDKLPRVRVVIVYFMCLYGACVSHLPAFSMISPLL